MEYPNITTDTLNAQVTRNGSVIYPNQKSLAFDRQIPIEIIQKAKEKQAPGFNATKPSVYWNKLQPYVSTHYDELEKEVEADKAARKQDDDTNPVREKLELAKLREEVTKLRNYNRAKDADFISRKLVINTYGNINKAVTTELRRVYENEQPAKTQNLPAEKILIINKELNDGIIKKLATPLHEWEKATDLPKEGDENADA